MDAASNAPAWQQAVFKALKEGDIRQIAYVPDAGHAHAIRSAVADPDIEDVVARLYTANGAP